jgi:hypothetical protein
MIRDDHRLQLELHPDGWVAWDITCPHPDPTPEELPSQDVPECRRSYDADGTWERVGCLVISGWDGPDDNLIGAGPEPLRLADLPAGWEWPADDALRVRPEPDQVLAERDRARATAVALEQQVDLLCRAIGQAGTVLAASGSPHAADQLVRVAERITDPNAAPIPAGFLDGLRALLDQHDEGEMAETSPRSV